MILPQLIKRHLKYHDDAGFYELQAKDAIRWLKEKQVSLGKSTQALDLGCGHGVFGHELLKEGCAVTFSDEYYGLGSELQKQPFISFNIDATPLAEVGQYDLVICSNVFEHLSEPEKFLKELDQTLKPGGFFFLSWTNWYSPWGGHDFAPFHYLGPVLGPKIHDKIFKKRRKHIPFKNLFPTHIGKTIKQIRNNKSVEIVAVAPRYYTEFSFLMKIPLLREFFGWNCAMLIQKK